MSEIRDYEPGLINPKCSVIESVRYWIEHANAYWQKEADRLEETVADKDRKIDDLEKRLLNWQEKAVNADNECYVLRGKVATLTSDVLHLRWEISNLTAKVGQAKERVRILEGAIRVISTNCLLLPNDEIAEAAKRTIRIIDGTLDVDSLGVLCPQAPSKTNRRCSLCGGTGVMPGEHHVDEFYKEPPAEPGKEKQVDAHQ